MWKLIGECKNAKACRDQSKTENERIEYTAKYTCLYCKVKKSCHNDRKEWLENRCNELQEAAAKNHTMEPYSIVQYLTGTRSNASTPINDKSGNILINMNRQDLHWIEHFKETQNQPDPMVTHNLSMDNSPKN